MKIKNYFLTTMACLIMLCFTGCSFTMPKWQVLGDEELNPIAEITARRIGWFVAKNENTNIETINKYCNKLTETSTAEINEMTLFGLRYLADKYAGDPMIADDLMSLVKLLGIDLTTGGISIDPGKERILKAVIQAFQKGLNT